MDRELIESIVNEVVEGFQDAQPQPRGKDGKFVAKGRAELKFAHANFVMRGLADRAKEFKNGNTRRSALASLKKLQPHIDSMTQGLHHPQTDEDGHAIYTDVHRTHSQLMTGVRQFNQSFKPDKGEQ
jgi:hypothetical protein